MKPLRQPTPSFSVFSSFSCSINSIISISSFASLKIPLLTVLGGLFQTVAVHGLSRMELTRRLLPSLQIHFPFLLQTVAFHLQFARYLQLVIFNFKMSFIKIIILFKMTKIKCIQSFKSLFNFNHVFIVFDIIERKFRIATIVIFKRDPRIDYNTSGFSQNCRQMAELSMELLSTVQTSILVPLSFIIVIACITICTSSSSDINS